MNIQKTILAGAIMALGLAGCGTEQQDGGNNIGARSADNQAPNTGIVVDGPVVRATVFYDLNGNLKRDSTEPFALTDNEGYFNANPNVRNYCDQDEQGSDSDYDKSPYCLRLTRAHWDNLTANTQIIITGGYDLYTGEPFEGSMSASARAAITENDSYISEDYSAIITPLTSIASARALPSEYHMAVALLSGYIPITDISVYLFSLGITDLTVNYLESEQVFDAKKFATTYQMHKFVSVVADWVKDLYPEVGEHEKLPEDVSSLVYKQFQNFHEGNYTLALTNIAQSMKIIYEVAEVPLPSATHDQALAAIADMYIKIADINSAIVSAFGYTNEDGLGTDLTFANVKARMRGVEVVVLKIIRGLPHTAAKDALANQAYLDNLAGDLNDNGNINFTQLVEFTGDATALTTESGLAAANTGVSLSDLAGKSLSFEDDDPSVNSKAAIFFTSDETGEGTPTKGQIHLCLQYDGNTDIDLEGNYISGSWDTIPALNNTVLLEMDLGGGMPAVLKKVGVNGSGATEYRFDYAERITKFSSADDLDVTADLNLESIPNSNETCQDYLGINNQLK